VRTVQDRCTLSPYTTLFRSNGAGKSTLMNILYGLIAPDEGSILIRGEPVTLRSPADAIARGIGMVHQHFMLIPVMTVAENVMLRSDEHTSELQSRENLVCRL